MNVLVASAEVLAPRLLGVPPLWREARDSLLLGILLLAAAFIAQPYFAPWWRGALEPYINFEMTNGFWP